MISEQERAWEREADLYRATEVRTMEVTMWITREGDDFSTDIEVTVECEVDRFGSLAAYAGYDKDGNPYPLTEKERDRAADQAWEEAHEE